MALHCHCHCHFSPSSPGKLSSFKCESLSGEKTQFSCFLIGSLIKRKHASQSESVLQLECKLLGQQKSRQSNGFYCKTALTQHPQKCEHTVHVTSVRIRIQTLFFVCFSVKTLSATILFVKVQQNHFSKFMKD